jgi:hypothetical protein
MPTVGSGSTTAFCTATLTTALSFLTPPVASDPTRNVRPWPLVSAIAAMAMMFVLFIARPRRRVQIFAMLALLAVIATSFAGCGGGSTSTGGGGTGTTSHVDSITAVYSGDANFAGSTSTAVSITVN